MAQWPQWKNAREERLPDLCVVCGKQDADQITRKKLQYQSKKAQALMMLGFICGGIPGVIIAVMTQKRNADLMSLFATITETIGTA